MKRSLYLATLFVLSSFTTMLMGECEECKNLKKELQASWQATLSFSKELRELAKANCDHAKTIQNLRSGI